MESRKKLKSEITVFVKSITAASLAAVMETLLHFLEKANPLDTQGVSSTKIQIFWDTTLCR
jgi:hypothetical protein